MPSLPLLTVVNSSSSSRLNQNTLYFAALIALSLSTTVFAQAGETTPDSPSNDGTVSRKNFSTDYEAATAAVADKNWPLAKQKLTAALKSLGDYSDPKKSAAQVLLSKADRALVKDDMLYTATELMRLKQWVEAEEAFRKVVDATGETETLRKNVTACREALEAENEDLKKADDLLKVHKWKESAESFNKAADKLGGIRMIRDGLNTVQLGAESDELFKKGTALLKEKKWEDAFNVYKRLAQIVGETDEVKKGAAQAQAGYAEEHKATTETPAAPAAPFGPSSK